MARSIDGADADNAGATTLIVFSRVLMRDRAEKHRLATEFESARAVQQVLVPEEIPNVPGFGIEAIYRPFGEVGGDFFQIIADIRRCVSLGRDWGCEREGNAGGDDG